MFCSFSSRKIIYRLLVLLLITLGKVTAQHKINPPIYFSQFAHFGNQLSGGYSLSYQHEGNIYRLGLLMMLDYPETRPLDFNSGALGTLLFGLEDPWDRSENIYLSFGHVLPLTKDGKVRFVANGGLAYSIMYKVYEWEKVENPVYGPNYRWKNKRYVTLGVLLNPRLEWHFSRFFGLAFTPIVFFNKDSYFAGAGIGFDLGWLRRKKQRYIPPVRGTFPKVREER